jgi:hypothetical protein
MKWLSRWRSVPVLRRRRGRPHGDYGVYGVPETYLIDRGRDPLQIGPVTHELLKGKIVPMIEALEKK